MAIDPKNLQNEKGHGGVAPWSSWMEGAAERTPELQWPLNLAVYDHMRRTNSQVAALLRAVFYPIMRYRWHLDPKDASEEVTYRIAEDLGLPVKGEGHPKATNRRRNRFDFRFHLRHALLDLVFGHMFFEQKVEIRDGKARLVKLAPRMPLTIQKIKVARDGGLEGIEQFGSGTPGEPNTLEIGVERLVAYCNEREGGDWAGSSILRPVYPHHLIRDRLLRVDAMKHERNGMGVPWIEAPPGATKEQIEFLDSLAQKYKVGEASGGSAPAGARLRLVGVEGSIPDTLASIRYADEQTSKIMLVQFLDLGTTGAGNRALGQSFIDFFDLALETVALDHAAVMTEHVVEDLVDWNEGEAEPAPAIGFEKLDPELSVAEFDMLVNDGAIELDDEVKDYVRDRHRLPPRDPATAPAPPAPPQPPQPENGPERGLPDDSVARGRLPFGGVNAAHRLASGRSLRRNLYSHEVAAATDWDALDVVFESTKNDLVGKWQFIRNTQAEELASKLFSAMEAIAGGDADIADLAKMIGAPTTEAGAEIILQHLQFATDEALELAMGELSAQGLETELPESIYDDLAEKTAARATATNQLLSESLRESALRKAVQLAADDPSPFQVANGVREHLLGLSNSYLEDQFGGALQAANNAARFTAFGLEEEALRFYASEILDVATCSPCTALDGTEYTSLADAQVDYPTGGYKSCLGGVRCRGTVVAVYREGDEQPPTETQPEPTPEPTPPLEPADKELEWSRINPAYRRAEAISDPADLEAIQNNRKYLDSDTGRHPLEARGNVDLASICDQQGFSDMPTRVSRADLDALIDEHDTPELWRAMHEHRGPNMNALDLQGGDYYLGNGIHGNGTYTGYPGTRTTRQWRNERSATTGQEITFDEMTPDEKSRAVQEFCSGYADTKGSLSRMTLDPRARVIGTEDLYKEHESFLDDLDQQINEATGQRNWDLRQARSILSDPGHYAAFAGYDAFYAQRFNPEIDDIAELGEMIVLNRTALVIQTDIERPLDW